MTRPEWLDGVLVQAAGLLGLSEPLVLPATVVELLASDVEVVLLDESDVPGGPGRTPRPELGLLGPDMPGAFHDYELAEYLPGAWPLALDGAGGLYCLDLRPGVAGASGPGDPAPLVWSHAGNLGWAPDEHVVVADDAETFLRSVVHDR